MEKGSFHLRIQNRHRLLHLIRGRHFDKSISPFLSSVSMNSNNRDLCASTGQKLLYWNCRGICSRREKLRKHLEEIEVFIGVETNLKKHKKFDLSCFRTYSIDRTQRPGGAIIFLVRKSLQFLKPIQDLCFIKDNQETGVIKLHNLNSTYNLAACCRVSGRSVSQIGWN